MSEIEYKPDGLSPIQWVKDVAKELKRTEGRKVNKGDLLAMSAKRDPFNKGTKGDFEKGMWFTGIYEKYGYSGIHVRDLHYRFLSAPKNERRLWYGEEYLNTEKCLGMMNEAAAVARILRLIDRDDITDNKAERPLLSLDPEVSEGSEPEFYLELPDSFASFGASPMRDLPNVEGGHGMDPNLEFEFEVWGYDYDPTLQPFVIEIWSEKSGDDHVLRRLAHRYGINYVPGAGFASHTTIRNMLKRLEALDKPGCILYVSDFDPAGGAMPKAVARYTQFECWELEEMAKEVAPNIKIDNAVLTHKQVQEYNLPPVPVKENDPRKARWELQYGDNAVEVNALEALRPGVLEEILETRIQKLQDDALEDKVQQAREEAEQRVSDEVQAILDSHREEIEDIHRRGQEIQERYRQLYDQLNAENQERYQRLGDRYDRHIGPLEEELAEAQNELREELEDLDIELPELPEGELENPVDRSSGNGWLFDSERKWVDQTRAFRRYGGLEE